MQIVAEIPSNAHIPSPDIAPIPEQFRRKAGRPSNAVKRAQLKDEAQAFETVKIAWTEHAQHLVDEARKASRDKKTDGKSLVALTTAAGIAYDKRWSKQVSDNTEISLPSSLAKQIALKLAQVNQPVTPEVAHLTGEYYQSVNEAIEALNSPYVTPGG